MTRNNIKFFSYLLIAVFLTLGLSISFQSLLAVWIAPTANPPNNNTDEPLNKGSSAQIKGGPLFVNYDNSPFAPFGLAVYGNVGIGVAAPSQKLEVAGNIKITGAGIYNSTGSQLVETNAADWTRWNQGSGSSNGNAMYQSLSLGSGGLSVGTWSNQGVGNIYATGILQIAGAGNSYISGKVGIGTTNPQAKLQIGLKVSDDNGYSYDSNSLMVIHQTPTSATTLNDPKTVLMLARQGTSGQAYGAAAAFNLSRYENNGVNSRTRMDISLANASFNPTTNTVMTLLSSGKVGIGTANPNNLLQVLDLIDFNNTDFNTKLGYQSGKNVVAGAQFNTFAGYQAGLSSVTLSTNIADYNSAFGYKSLFSNTAGNNNVANGAYSLYSNTAGVDNIANGAYSLYSNTAGNFNIANGYQSLYSNTTGAGNTANGYQSLYSNTTGYQNTANGYFSLYSNTTGYYNIANGFDSGRFIADGATVNQTSNNSLYLGYNTKALANGDTNEIVIGASAIGNGSNSVTLGNTSITKTILQGKVGIGTASPLANLEIAGAPASLTSSHVLDLSRAYVGGVSYALAASLKLATLSGVSGTRLDFALLNSNNTTDMLPDTTVMSLTSTGNVGIGAMNPGEKLEVNGAIKFGADASTISKAPRVIHTEDPVSGCPPARPAGADLFAQTFTLARGASVYIDASIIRNYNGRADLLLYVDGAQKDQTLDYTPSAQWFDSNVHWAGTLAAGVHTVSLRGNIANIWGCGGSWGSIDTIIFE